MKRSGFMMIETMLAMSAITFIALITLNIITTNQNNVQRLKEHYSMVCELQNHLTLKLLNPTEKNVTASLLFQRENIIIKTKMAEIEPRSSLKKYAQTLQLFQITGHKEGDKEHSKTLMGIVITPQNSVQN